MRKITILLFGIIIFVLAGCQKKTSTIMSGELNNGVSAIEDAMSRGDKSNATQRLAKGDLPPTYYVYGTEDPFYEQFERQYDVISSMGIKTGRIVLNGWPHGFGSDGGWVGDYADWIENIFKELKN